MRALWVAIVLVLGGCASAPAPSRHGSSTVEVVYYPGHPKSPNRQKPNVPSTPPPTLAPTAGNGSRCERLTPLILEAAQTHNIEPGTLFAIVNRESGFDPKAKNRSGAAGLMQVMPGTAKSLKCSHLLDAKSNLDCGSRLLARLLKRYDGKSNYALAAYAVGSRSVDVAWKAKRSPPRASFYTKIHADARAWRSQGCAGLSKGKAR